MSSSSQFIQEKARAKPFLFCQPERTAISERDILMGGHLKSRPKREGGLLRPGTGALWWVSVLAVHFSLRILAAETADREPLVPAHSTVVLLAGLPGDVESEN